MILTKQIRLDLPVTTFFVQINDYRKWIASFQISIKPQEIVLAFASRNGKFNEGVNKFCSTVVPVGQCLLCGWLILSKLSQFN